MTDTADLQRILALLDNLSAALAREDKYRLEADRLVRRVAALEEGLRDVLRLTHDWAMRHPDIDKARALLDPDRCDRIVNNGTGEPTECGRTLPCEYHAAPAALGAAAAEWHRYLHQEGILVEDEGQECGPWHHRVFLAAPAARKGER